MDRNFKNLTKELLNVWKDYPKQGTKKWSYEVAAHDLQYQLGSLTKALLQLKGYRLAGGLSKKQIKDNLSDELVDILAEVLFIADELDVDLEGAWEKMLESDKRKISKGKLLNK